MCKCTRLFLSPTLCIKRIEVLHLHHAIYVPEKKNRSLFFSSRKKSRGFYCFFFQRTGRRPSPERTKAKTKKEPSKLIIEKGIILKIVTLGKLNQDILFSKYDFVPSNRNHTLFYFSNRRIFDHYFLRYEKNRRHMTLFVSALPSFSLIVQS